MGEDGGCHEGVGWKGRGVWLFVKRVNLEGGVRLNRDPGVTGIAAAQLGAVHSVDGQ